MFDFSEEFVSGKVIYYPKNKAAETLVRLMKRQGVMDYELLLMKEGEMPFRIISFWSGHKKKRVFQ